MEFHDVSKHRSCIVQASSLGHHGLPDQPKMPGSLFRPATRTVENIANEFHTFGETLLIEVVEELSCVFSITVNRIDHA